MSAIVCCDLDEERAEACKRRLDRLANSKTSSVLHGDSVQLVERLVSKVPTGALTIALIDPFKLELIQFDVFRTIASRCRADLIFLFADSMDLNRHYQQYIQPGNRIDRMLGDGEWRSSFDELDTHAEEVLCGFFRSHLEDRLRRELDYQFFGQRAIGTGNRRYYTLMFASKSERGFDFWHKACAKDADGQQELF